MFVRLLKLFRRNRDKSAPDKTGASANAAAANEPDADDTAPLPEDPNASKAWLGIGLDGTLATDEGTGLGGPIGAPVYNTVQRLRDWVEHRGLTVKVITPRAATEEGAQAVRDWLQQHKLPALEVTAKKNLNMVEMWSACCVQVISNTGQIVGTSPRGLDQPAATAASTTAPSTPSTDGAR